MYPSCGVRSVIKRGRLWRGMGKPKPLSSVLSTSHLPDTWFTVFTPTPSRLNNVTLTDAMGAELKMGSHDKTFPFPSQRAIYSTCSVRGLIYSEDNERTFSMRWDEKRICVMTASVTADWGDLKKKKKGVGPSGSSLQWPLTPSQSLPHLKWNAHNVRQQHVKHDMPLRGVKPP